MRAGERPAAPDDRRSGDVCAERHAVSSTRAFGRYRLVAPLHRSATAEVWQAVNPAGARSALKIATAGRYVELLRGEAAWLASLTHAHIVRMYELIEDAGTAALALEYLPGGDLVSLSGAAPRHWLGAVADLVATLAWLHERGVAHRDVKARNVMFDGDERVRLIDFGSAARFGAARAPGGTTARHRIDAPGAVSAADDVHALAVLLHELATGRLPDTGPAPPAGGGRAGGRAAAADADLGPGPRAALREAPADVRGAGLARLDALVAEALSAAPGAVRPDLGAFANGIELALREET